MAKRYIQLTEKERYCIEILIQEGYSNKMISQKLGRDKSTIGREIKRNSNGCGNYFSEEANSLAKNRRKREFFSKFTDIAKYVIEDKLQDKWTPEQISAELKLEYNIFISHELIYQYINNDRKSGGTLYKLLPCRGNKYKKRNIKTRVKIWKKVAKRISISERPNKKILTKHIGNWEGDMIEGKGHRSGLGTFVDMKSKYVIIRKLRDKSSEEMKNVLIDSFINCHDLINTLTVDNGNEFALHSKISSDLKTKVYFANPYSPWERGLSENTNGLIRRFYPKGTDFSKVTDRELLKVQDLLNNRPRKTLGFKKPKQVFAKEVLKNNKYAAI
jgi:IS30 family transposase